METKTVLKSEKWVNVDSGWSWAILLLYSQTKCLCFNKIENERDDFSETKGVYNILKDGRIQGSRGVMTYIPENSSIQSILPSIIKCRAYRWIMYNGAD